MPEKFGPENIGSKVGIPLDVEDERPNQKAIEEKRDEYIRKAFSVVLKQVKENNPDKYEILEAELQKERASDEYEISDVARAVLEEMVFHVKKQIYADHGGETSEDENGRDVIENEAYFEKLDIDYPDDVVEVLIVDEITGTQLDEFGRVLK